MFLVFPVIQSPIVVQVIPTVQTCVFGCKILLQVGRVKIPAFQIADNLVNDESIKNIQLFTYLYKTVFGEDFFTLLIFLFIREHVTQAVEQASDPGIPTLILTVNGDKICQQRCYDKFVLGRFMIMLRQSHDYPVVIVQTLPQDS